MASIFGIDYPTLWFLVVGGVFSGYAILDGFDLGAGALHLFFKKDESRRIALNAVGPVWDGNEVWLIIGGGTLFAGFPILYATLFSAMYIPLMLFLLCIILRAISIEFRSKEPMKWWRNTWDISYSISSMLIALLLGVVLGNVLQGMPINEQLEFEGSWLMFLNPYAILVGLTTLVLMVVHGAIYLCLKTEGKLFQKVEKLLMRSIIIFVVLFICISVYSLLYIPHLSDNFTKSLGLYIIPIIAILSIANIPRLASKRKFKEAFIFSALTFSSLLVLVALELYPALILSTSNPENSITIYNSVASDKSIGIMLLFVAIGVPLVLTYTFIVYKTFWGKVKMDETSY